ncbi:MAG: hypothetical protein ACLSA6_14535 [Holdemania massiliensis]
MCLGRGVSHHCGRLQRKQSADRRPAIGADNGFAQRDTERGVSVKGVQADVTYPLEGLDDTLAMNNLTAVKLYAGQGKVSVTPEGAESLTCLSMGRP